MITKHGYSLVNLRADYFRAFVGFIICFSPYVFGAEAGGGFVRNLFIVTKDGTITLSLFSDKKDNFSANDYSSWIDAFSMSRLSYTSNQKVIPLKRVAAKGVEA